MAERKKDRQQKPVNKPQRTSQSKNSSSSFFRFGESYSSLILGIVVVIVTTILLVFLVKDRNSQFNNDTLKINKNVSSTNTNRVAEVTRIARTSITPQVTLYPTITNEPTISPTKKPTVTLTTKIVSPTITARPTKQISPTIKATPTLTITPTRKLSATPIPTKTVIAQKNNVRTEGKVKVHTVSNGESLWTIAEKYYKSGYNWVDIAKANNISNPGLITSGTKLNIPDVAPKLATVTTPQDNKLTAFGPKITTTTYTVQKGDHLWGIAVRAYGDGYKWTEIARVNNVTNPSVIHAGLELKLPRTKGLSVNK